MNNEEYGSHTTPYVDSIDFISALHDPDVLGGHLAVYHAKAGTLAYVDGLAASLTWRQRVNAICNPSAGSDANFTTRIQFTGGSGSFHW